ncbi:MAG: asparaginase [Clostridia bacterium]|nr:asparaginase [Clostridia bacterium]
MKLLFVFTGGTIGSAASGAYIGLDGKHPRMLLQKYAERYGDPGPYDTAEPCTLLSENSTGRTLRSILVCVRQAASRYDGIVVTHGTDTLAYTAAALAYTLGSGCVPVCVVSAGLPPEDPASNGPDHLHAALRLIQAGRRGVWVPYRSGNGPVRVYPGARVPASLPFTDALCGPAAGQFGPAWSYRRDPAFRPAPDGQPPLPADRLTETAARILRVEPYPGMVYPAVPAAVRYVLHGSYHSGTVGTATRQTITFMQKMARRGVRVYLTGVGDGTQYESTAAFAQLGVRPLPRLMPAAAYIKLWLADSAGLDPDAVLPVPLSGDL